MKLSVVTVTYRDADGLRATLDSLQRLASLNLSWEHIVVDSSPEINASTLDGLPPSWPLIHLTPPPEGIYRAMNEGIRRANGDFLWFLNGGDLLQSPSTLQKFLMEFADEKIDFVCGGCDLVKGSIPLYPKRPHSTFLKNILFRNQISHQAVLYRKSLMDRVGEFNPEFKISADYEHYFRAYLLGMRARCLPDVLVLCDLTGTSNTKWRESIRESARISKNLRAQMPLSLFLAHQFFCFVEYTRVATLKTMAKYFPGNFLQKIWIRWQRRH